VRESAVLAREDRPGDQRLVAYLVPHPEPAPTRSELRSFLQEQLPAYMAPSAFVWLEALPLLPSGKVDRGALPEPTGLGLEWEESFVAPRTPVEQVLAGIWAALLGVAEVGIHDDFFELGGHSLLATRVISRVREAFQVEVPLRSLFEQPTIAELARQITERQAAGREPETLARLLAEVEALSEGEVQRLLAERNVQVTSKRNVQVTSKRRG
jgi:acyl carrier protein